MPVLSGASTSNPTTLQQLILEMRVYPEFIPVLGTSGYTEYPMLSICNDLMQRFLAESMPWTWNRAYIPSILTVALQQDYVTQITDIGWLENATRIDINNSTNNGNLAPKPQWPMYAIRDQQLTSTQGQPDTINFIPNRLATFGQWYANTAYGCGYGVAQIPITPIQQFVDVNGNILYIDSTVLGLNLNSPGFNGQPITLPANSPYGISGSTQPFAPANATPGSTVQDGTVVWTVADPNGYAMRVSPLPAFSGLAWLLQPVYQIKPPTITRLQQDISPIPPEMNYLFRQGLRAMLYDHAGSPKAGPAYAKWEEDLVAAVRSADRQSENYSMTPCVPIMGGGGWYGEVGIGNNASIGPAQPFGPVF
jgi:hypothetical protein